MPTVLKYLRDHGTPFMGRRDSVKTGATKELGAPAIATTVAPHDKDAPRRSKTGGPLNARFTFLPYVDSTTQETAAHVQAYLYMMREPMVKASVLSKTLAVAALDLNVTPDDPENKREQEAADFVKWALHNVGMGVQGQTIGIPGLVENITIPKLIQGFVTANKVTRPVECGRWSGKYTLAECVAKPENTYQTELDEYGKVVNIKGMVYNTGEDFDPSLFVISRYMPLWANPRGMSDFRAAYRAFWIKDTTWKLRAIFLEKFGAGFLVGKYREQDQKDLLETALMSARGSTWMAVPTEVIIEPVNIAARGTADYESAIRDLDHEIAVSITGAFLQSGEGSTTGSFAMGKVHKDTAELQVWYLAENLAGDINSQIVPDLVRMNFAGIGSMPKVSFGGVNDGELAAALAIDTGLYNMDVELSKADLRQRYRRAVPKDDADRVKRTVPSSMAITSQQGQQQGGDPTASGNSDLLNTVGGSTSLTGLQTAYATGELSREMALANAIIVFGLDQRAADKLFPVIADRPADEVVDKSQPAGGPAAGPFPRTPSGSPSVT